jgi:hypothetical protein
MTHFFESPATEQIVLKAINCFFSFLVILKAQEDEAQKTK